MVHRHTKIVSSKNTLEQTFSLLHTRHTWARFSGGKSISLVHSSLISQSYKWHGDGGRLRRLLLHKIEWDSSVTVFSGPLSFSTSSSVSASSSSVEELPGSVPYNNGVLKSLSDEQLLLSSSKATDLCRGRRSLICYRIPLIRTECGL